MLRDLENERWFCLLRSEQFASFTEGQGLIKGLLSWSLSAPLGTGMTSSSMIIDSLSISGQRERLWACGISPSQSRKTFSWGLASYKIYFLIKKGIHTHGGKKSNCTMKGKSPSCPKFLVEFSSLEEPLLPNFCGCKYSRSSQNAVLPHQYTKGSGPSPTSASCFLQVIPSLL